MTELQIPKSRDLLFPTLRALEHLGGSASISELSEQIAADLKLADEILDIPHQDGPRSEVDYQSAWARTYLSKMGLIENKSRAIWAITDAGRRMRHEDRLGDLFRDYQAKKIKDRRRPLPDDGNSVGDAGYDWQQALLQIVRGIDSNTFERLCQRVLREAGFTRVEVTGRSGDGGIDGTGVLRINLISFHVHFQCKRYIDAVGPSAIRDFRGAMVGKADKGLFITTGWFTKGAKQEATRTVTPAIDLIDGIDLCGLLKKYELGVKTVEEIKPNQEFFDNL